MKLKFLVIVSILLLMGSPAMAKKQASVMGQGQGGDPSKAKLHIYIFGSEYVQDEDTKTDDDWTDESWVLQGANEFDLRVTNTDNKDRAYHTTLVVAVYPPGDENETPDDVNVSITTTDGVIGSSCVPALSDYMYSDDPGGDNGWTGFGKHSVFSQGAWYFLCDLNPNDGLPAPYGFLEKGGDKDDVENGIPGNPDYGTYRMVHVDIDPGSSEYRVHFDAVAFDEEGNFIMKNPFSHDCVNLPEISLLAGLGIILLSSGCMYWILRERL